MGHLEQYPDAVSSSGRYILQLKVVPLRAENPPDAVQIVSYCSGSRGVCSCGNWISDVRMQACSSFLLSE